MKTPYFGSFLAVGAVAFAFTLLGGAKPPSAQILTYDNLTDFSNDSGSAYFEPFTKYNGEQRVPGPQLFPSGQPTGYQFTLNDNDPNGIDYSSHPGQASVFAAADSGEDSLVIKFPLANVTAFAGTFFLSDYGFNPLAGDGVTVTAYTATSSQSVTVASTGSYGTEPFVGFTSATPFTEITITGPISVGDDVFAFLSLDNVYLSQSFDTVPEPSSWALMLGGMGLLLVVIRRRPVQAGSLR